MKTENPRAMKLARGAPLYKNRNETAPGNFRLISLKPYIAKLIESLIYDSLVNHVEMNNKMS